MDDDRPNVVVLEGGARTDDDVRAFVESLPAALLEHPLENVVVVATTKDRQVITGHANMNDPFTVVGALYVLAQHLVDEGVEW